MIYIYITENDRGCTSPLAISSCFVVERSKIIIAVIIDGYPISGHINACNNLLIAQNRVSTCSGQRRPPPHHASFVHFV